jgi:hypothetical protein
MAEFAVVVLALWALTHCVSEVFRHAQFGRPLGCQKCLSGWIILATALRLFAYDHQVWWALIAMAAWAVSILIEAAYERSLIQIL